MEAIRAAFAVQDPVLALDAVVEAACAMWEGHGFIVEQLQAIAILERGASAVLEAQWEDQRAELQGLTRRLARADRSGPGWARLEPPRRCTWSPAWSPS